MQTATPRPARTARAAGVPSRHARRLHPDGRKRTGLRWDRVGRSALLLVFFLVVLAYVGPARSLISALGESKDRAAQVADLRERNARLKARATALESDVTLQQEARKLGMVEQGGRAYVIEGLPNR